MKLTCNLQYAGRARRNDGTRARWIRSTAWALKRVPRSSAISRPGRRRQCVMSLSCLRMGCVLYNIKLDLVCVWFPGGWRARSGNGNAPRERHTTARPSLAPHITLQAPSPRSLPRSTRLRFRPPLFDPFVRSWFLVTPASGSKKIPTMSDSTSTAQHSAPAPAVPAVAAQEGGADGSSAVAHEGQEQQDEGLTLRALVSSKEAGQSHSHSHKHPHKTRVTHVGVARLRAGRVLLGVDAVGLGWELASQRASQLAHATPLSQTLSNVPISS